MQPSPHQAHAGSPHRSSVRARLPHLVAALAVLTTVTGCASPGPLNLPSGEGETKVAVTATVQSSPTLVLVDYRITNGSTDTVWAVRGPSAAPLPDVQRDRVALALAFFPVRTDVTYAQPPSVAVQSIPPGATAEGTLRVQRPFRPFAETDGGRPVTLPAEPTSVRLCVGYVPTSALPAAQAPRTAQDDEGPRLAQEIGHAHQSLSCSGVLPLG